MFFSTTKIKEENKLNDLNCDKNTHSCCEKNITYESLREKIRELAYLKWEQAGCPWGQDKDFWIEAEKELFGENPLQHGGYRVKNKNSYILICPIHSEIPVDTTIET